MQVLPDYAGACLANVVPALLLHDQVGRGWIPDEALDARQVVVLLVDGLGWEQLSDRWALAPTLASLTGGPITTVVPSTTVTALTSLTTGTAPAEHGLVGYRLWTGGEVLNALRWTTPAGDARQRLDPAALQPVAPFVGQDPVVISKAEFAGTGFTVAHLRGSRLTGYWSTSSIAVEVRHALAGGERLIYAYYDGIDKIAHATGLGEHYRAELELVDRLVAELLASLPPGAALLVTADHGQVEVGDRMMVLSDEILAATAAVSGEARFLWLHAKGDRAGELLDAATSAYGHLAWIHRREQILDEAWFGKPMSSVAKARLGDVAVVAREPVGFTATADHGPPLVGRHGSVTAAEMLVPLLAAAR